MEERLNKENRIQWEQNDENETKKIREMQNDTVNDRASIAIL